MASGSSTFDSHSVNACRVLVNCKLLKLKYIVNYMKQEIYRLGRGGTENERCNCECVGAHLNLVCD